MQDRDQAGLGAEIKDAVQCRVSQAGDLTGNFRGDEFLVDAKLADAGKYAGKCSQHPLDMIGSIHIGRVETDDHRIKAVLLLRRQFLIETRDIGIGERIVIQRCIALQVITRCIITRVLVRPGLLQRDTEQRRAPYPVTHDDKVILDTDALLDVVGQVEMAVMKLSIRRHLCFGDTDRCDHHNEQGNTETERCAGRTPVLFILLKAHVHVVVLVISKLTVTVTFYCL